MLSHTESMPHWWDSERPARRPAISVASIAGNPMRVAARIYRKGLFMGVCGPGTKLALDLSKRQWYDFVMTIDQASGIETDLKEGFSVIMGTCPRLQQENSL
jgi:hypothetical protein